MYIEKIFLDQEVNKQIPFICHINFEKYFIKAIENFFPVFIWPDINTTWAGRIHNSYANPQLRLGFA